MYFKSFFLVILEASKIQLFIIYFSEVFPVWFIV